MTYDRKRILQHQNKDEHGDGKRPHPAYDHNSAVKEELVSG